MDIHVVRPRETLTSIATQYGVSLSRLLADNQLPDPGQLVTGQTIVIRYPAEVYTVRPGDTLTSIAAANGLTVRALMRQNPNLRGEETIYPGQTLVLRYQGEKRGTLSVNGYAYPFIDKGLLQRELPFLTNLTPFTYGITPQGGLVDLDDTALIAAAKSLDVAPLMHLSTLTEDGGFSNELASLVLNDMSVQDNLVEAVKENLQSKGYRGLDVDFEFVFAQDAAPYAAFIARLRRELSPLGYPVIVALAPKTSATQPGLLYEGHNYRALGQAANQVLLMTYGWYILTHRPKSIDITGFERCLHTFFSAFSGGIQQYTFGNGFIHILSHYNADCIVNVRASMEFVAQIHWLGADAPKTHSRGGNRGQGYTSRLRPPLTSVTPSAFRWLRRAGHAVAAARPLFILGGNVPQFEVSF